MSNSSTIAEQISEQFNNDGLCFQNNDKDLSDILEKHCIDKMQSWSRGATRFEFSDGSAIVVAGECWDLGFYNTECTCFKHEGHCNKYCELVEV